MSTHLVKHQKITKRQMKEDPLVTAAFKATDLWERHGSRILVAGGALALLGLLAFFMSQARAKAYADAGRRSQTDNERGRAMLAQARSLLRAGQTAKASDVYHAILNLPSVEQQILDSANVHLGELSATQQTP